MVIFILSCVFVHLENGNVNNKLQDDADCHENIKFNNMSSPTQNKNLTSESYSVSKIDSIYLSSKNLVRFFREINQEIN